MKLTRYKTHSYHIVGGQYERSTYRWIIFLWWSVHIIQVASVFALIYETMDGWENAQSFEDATGFILFITSGYVVSFYIGSDWGNNYLFWSSLHTLYGKHTGCFIKITWLAKIIINVGLMAACIALSL